MQKVVSYLGYSGRADLPTRIYGRPARSIFMASAKARGKSLGGLREHGRELHEAAIERAKALAPILRRAGRALSSGAALMTIPKHFTRVLACWY